MKNFSIALAILAAIVFTACNKNDVVVIRLNETNVEMVKGSTKQLIATVVPEDKNAAIEWFSSMPEYVSVSETGMLKAEKMYFKNPTDTEVTPVSIYCKYNGGAAECKVTVLPLDVAGIELKIVNHKEGEVLKLEPGATKQLVVNYAPADADIDFSKLEWKSSDFNYVSVKGEEGTAYATITANWAGSATISVRYSNFEASVGVIVNHIEATSVAISNKTDNTVVEGHTLQLGASFFPANATVEKIWSIVEGSEHATIVSDSGLLTALSAGTVKVRVNAGKVYDELTITVLEDTAKN